MSYIWTERFSKKPGNPERCRSAVSDRESGGWYRTHQCERKPTVFRTVDGVEYGFCKQHDPVEVERRNKARSEAYNAEWKAKELHEKRRKQTAAAMDGCKLAIEKIAAGHNDPRALAVEALSAFPPSNREAP